MKNFFNVAQNIFSGFVPEIVENSIVSFCESSMPGYSAEGSPSERIEVGGSVEGENRKTFYTICLANTQNQKKAARDLIGKMYSWRNFRSDNVLQESSRLTTFVAYDGCGRLVGTVTVGLDSHEGLFAEEAYRDEITSLRLSRGKVCEFTCLAVLPEVKSRKVLGGLFHVAMLYASRMFNHSGVVFEVIPRHAQFYEKMLGMNRIASGRICKRANVAAVLIHSDFSYVEEQIERIYGESPEEDEFPLGKDRSLYRYFFNSFEAAGIVRRFDELLKKEKSGVQNASAFPSLSLSPLFASNSN